MTKNKVIEIWDIYINKLGEGALVEPYVYSIDFAFCGIAAQMRFSPKNLKNCIKGSLEYGYLECDLAFDYEILDYLDKNHDVLISIVEDIKKEWNKSYPRSEFNFLGERV